MRCKYCGGNVIGERCLQCSRPAVAVVPYRIRSFDECEEEERRKIMRKKTVREGLCRCCGGKHCLRMDGLCSSCAAYVDGRRGKYYPVKSPQREEVLARVRERKVNRMKRIGC